MKVRTVAILVAIVGFGILALVVSAAGSGSSGSAPTPTATDVPATATVAAPVDSATPSPVTAGSAQTCWFMEINGTAVIKSVLDPSPYLNCGQQMQQSQTSTSMHFISHTSDNGGLPRVCVAIAVNLPKSSFSVFDDTALTSDGTVMCQALSKDQKDYMVFYG